MTRIFSLISSIIWIEFLLISHCECPEGNTQDVNNQEANTGNPGVEGAAPQNPAETDPLEKEFEFKAENLVRKPIRKFEVGSRGYKIQAALGYLAKPEWPSEWIMTEEILQVEGHIYEPSMGIVNLHYSKYKGENVAAVIIGNSAVNCEHEQIKMRCKADKTSGYSMYPKKSFFSFSSNKKYQRCSPKSLATAIAGIIGMSDEGDKCGVGIAPKCLIGNIVIEPSSSNGSPENCAYKLSTLDNSLVFVHAWQMPLHDFRSGILRHWGNFDYMNIVSEKSYLQLKPHVMGAGDLGLIANSCQTNEYTSSDSSFVFGSVGYHGFLTPYTETCASLMGVTYSTTYGHEFYNEIATIPSSDNVVPSSAPKATTAVSAAVAGGIIVLIIDYYKKRFGKNPTVNDLAFLLAFSANSKPLRNKNMLWFENAAGLNFSPQGGFGLPNLNRAVDLIDAWTPVGAPRMYKCSKRDKANQFNCKTENNVRRSSTYTSNMVCSFRILDALSTLYIQTVTIEISAKLLKRGSMSVYLFSPSGTVSCLLEGRPYDTTRDNYKRLRLRTNHFMGERLLGDWTIKIFTYKEKSIPTFNPLYAIKKESENPSSPLTSPPPESGGDPKHPAPTASASTSPPLVSPFPLNSGGDPNNPVPKDFSPTTSINTDILPAATTQGLVLESSDSKNGPNTGSPPAALAKVNSVKEQQPQSAQGSPPVNSANGLSTDPRPAAPARVDSIANQPAQSATNQGAPPTSQPAPAAGANTPQKEPQENNPHFPNANAVSPPNPTGSGDVSSANTAAAPGNSQSTSAPATRADPKNGAPANRQPASAPAKVPSGRTSQANRNRQSNREKIETEVSHLSFTFILAENLPQELKITQKPKNAVRTQFEFELMKMWADFRQYLLVQTDPQNYGTGTVELREVYGIMNIFIQKLLMIQSNFNLKSGTSIPADFLNTVTLTDDHELHPILQHSDSLAREGVHPNLSPSRKKQNEGTPVETQKKQDPVAPTAGSKGDNRPTTFGENGMK